MRDAMILLPQRTDESESSARSDCSRGSVHRRKSIALWLCDLTVRPRAENAVGCTRSYVYQAPLFTGLATDSRNRGLDRTLKLTSVLVGNATRLQGQVPVGQRCVVADMGHIRHESIDSSLHRLDLCRRSCGCRVVKCNEKLCAPLPHGDCCIGRWC